jgi:hypothetical protein
MSTVKFLCDEDVKTALVACMGRLDPGMEIVAIGQPDVPTKGTLDPDLLLWAEKEGFALLTRDKNTMPGHVRDHLAGGHHSWGVFMLRDHRPWREITEDLLAIWSASSAEEWVDQIIWIPM